MNKKLLAVAVASAVAVPGVVAADASFYGSLKPRINVQDSNLSMSDGASRIGWKPKLLLHSNKISMSWCHDIRCPKTTAAARRGHTFGAPAQ